MSGQDENNTIIGDQQAKDPWTQSGVQPGTTTNAESLEKGDWQQDVINRLAFAALNEQRRARRWGLFFKFLAFAYFTVILWVWLAGEGAQTSLGKGKHVALVDVDGVISADRDANADSIITGLRHAFDDKNTAGVIMRINSPGGSPVQAGYINDEIVRLRSKYPDIRLYAVIGDICASGGYYIASAADEIYADKASLVGSIGVIMDGFGFVDAIKKLGVERRLITAGKNKGFLDPFSPQKKEEVAHVQGLLANIHRQFIEVVKQGRGDRLKTTTDLFSGLVWTGEQGVELGLVDGLGSSSYVAREIIGVERIVDFTPRPDYLDRFADSIGLAMARILASTVEISIK